MDRRVNVWIQRISRRKNLAIQWFDPASGRRRTESTGTADPEKAERRRTDREYELNHGLYHEPARLPWPDFRAAFELEYFPNCRPSTRALFRCVFDHFERICRPTTLGAITVRTLAAFLAGLRAVPGRDGNATMTPLSIHVRLSFLETALRWAARQKLLPACPAFPAVKVPRRKPRPVSAESFERLLAKAPDARMRAFLQCGWLAGLRLAEAFYLEWEQTDEAPFLDLGANRIVFPAEFVKATEDQWVPLDLELRRALEALPRGGPRVFRFLRPDGKPLTHNRASQQVADIARAAGVKMSMRTLRRGFGCYYATRVPAQVLQKLMRHSDIRITMTYYANVDTAVEDAVRGRHCEPRCSAAMPDAVVEVTVSGAKPSR